MVKKTFQDIVPPNKRSIRHIPIPGGRRSPVIDREEKTPPSASRRVRRKRLVNLSRWVVIVASLAFLMLAVAGVPMLFSSATIIVTPKQTTAVLDAVLQASLEGSAGLRYTIAAATSTATEIIPTNREAEIQKKASGQIVIYNNYSSESQRLIKGTRFEAADGRIYKINESVVVPGQRVEAGKKVPGSLSVSVYADVSGPEYNLELSDLKGDFSIPGFKGTPRYEAFYARQKTDIAGGFSGKARVVDDKSLEVAENKLKAALSEQLWESLRLSIPADFVVFRTLYTVQFSASSADNPNGDGVLVSVTATARTAVFNSRDLSSVVAERTLKDFDTKDSVLIGNMEDVSILPSGQENNDNLFEAKNIVMNVKGNVRFVWQFDERSLKNALSGRKKDDIYSIMGNYPSVVKAEVIIKPPWLSKYPSSIDKIHVVQKLDQ